MSKENIFKKHDIFLLLFCLFAFGFVVESKAQTQSFIIDGTINDKDRAILSIQLDKDSLLILVGEGDEIGGKIGMQYKIEKIGSKEVDNKKAIGLDLSDELKNGEMNAMVILANKIAWGSRIPKKDSPVLLIENLRDAEGYRFDFDEFLVAAEKKIKSIATTPSTQNNSLTYDKGVVINGVKWATRNIEESGQFVSSQEKYGLDYTWEVAKNACPTGWYLPTMEDFRLLLDANKVSNRWTSQNGVNGYLFTDKTTGATLFLPAAGGRDGNTGTLDWRGQEGYYWSSIPFSDNGAYYFRLYGNGGGCRCCDWFYRTNGFSIRPVAN